MRKLDFASVKTTFWFPTWSNTNQAVQLQKMARGLKFQIKKVKGLFYLRSENKGADQLRDYREADLCLSFRICKNVGALITWLICFNGEMLKVILYLSLYTLFIRSACFQPELN